MATLQDTDIQGPSTGFGIFPVGTIIPIASDYTDSYSIPSTGTVSHGWMLCDGAEIPAGNTLTGSVPNLTDSRFLRGNTTASAGTTGGAASATLSNTHLPGHTHTGNIGQYCHNHGVSDPTHRHCIKGYCSDYGAGTTFQIGYGNQQRASSYASTGISIQNRCLSHSFTTAACGSGTSFSIVPKYLDVVYLIRVK